MQLIALVMLVLGASACSSIVSPEQEPRCEIDGGVDPCPKSLFCIEGRCREQACADDVEKCSDNVDNDCDHKVDEGIDELCGDRVDNDCDSKVDEGHDADGDKITWCGDLTSPLGKDCDDNDKRRFPGNVEECDNLDNDCDDRTDEAAEGTALCESGTQCITGKCVVPGCDTTVKCANNEKCIEGQCIPTGCTPTSCPAGSRCDASGVCVPEVKFPNGHGCTRAAECASGLCVDNSTMNFSAEAKICALACCADSDCGRDELCIMAKSGARSCLPKSFYQGYGQQCSGGAASCGTGKACGIDAYPTVDAGLPKYRTSVCLSEEANSLQLNDRCFFDWLCKSQLCVPGPANTFFDVCSTPCGSSADCALFAPRPAETDKPPTTYCRYLRGDLVTVTGDSAYISYCAVSRGETGNGSLGTPCRIDNECADGACINAARGMGVCAPTCCKDDQCRMMKPNARCVPVSRGTGYYEMRCIEPPQ